MIPQLHLDQYAKELDAEIRKVEDSIRSLQDKLADLQKRKDAVGYLAQPNRQGVAGNANGNPHFGLPANPWPASGQLRRRNTGAANGSGEQTLYTQFDKPLLESLAALPGGKGTAEEVLQGMKSKMAPILKPKDFDVVSSGEERWRNTARWRRNALLKLGFLRTDSPRGIWEISEAGRAWLKKAS